MKRTTFSSFDVTRVCGSDEGRSAAIGDMPPPPAIFAPFLNTVDSRRMSGPAWRGYIVPIAVEPRSSTMVNFGSRTASHDKTSHGSSVAQSRTGPGQGMTSSISASVTSDVTSGHHRHWRTRRSGTKHKSHSQPVESLSKDTGSKEQSEQTGAANMVLLCIACVLVIIVILFLVLFSFSTRSRTLQHLHAGTGLTTQASESTQMSTSSPAPPRPAAGHVDAPCNDDSACLGEASCVHDVCTCEGPDVRVVEGVCVAASTTVTEQPSSTKATTETTSSVDETLPSAIRFTFVRTVRLPAATTSSTSQETARVTAEADPALNTAELSAVHVDERAAVSNITAQAEEAEGQNPGVQRE